MNPRVGTGAPHLAAPASTTRRIRAANLHRKTTFSSRCARAFHYGLGLCRDTISTCAGSDSDNAISREVCRAGDACRALIADTAPSRPASAHRSKQGAVRPGRPVQGEKIIHARREAGGRSSTRELAVSAIDGRGRPASFWRIRRVASIRPCRDLAVHQHLRQATGGCGGHSIGPVGGDDAFQPELFEPPLDHALV